MIKIRLNKGNYKKTSNKIIIKFTYKTHVKLCKWYHLKKLFH